MRVKSYYLAPLLVLIVFTLVFNSCEAPKYYENVQRVFPAVVRVSIEDRMGSGVIITDKGYILTSKHVIGDSKSPTVMLNNGTQYQATVAAADEARDLAVIKLPDNPAGYPYATLGSSTESDTLQTGSPVLVVGYPGENDINHLMLSTGSICRFPRIDSVQFLQTEAKIYPGSSGGPMTNSNGDVIGIINSQYTNLKDSCATFATAISEAKPLLDSLATSQQPVVPEEKNTSTSGLPCATVGCPAPDFSLSTPDLKEISLNSLKGKKVILAFLTTRCISCVQVALLLGPVYAAWPRDQLEIVMIVSREGSSDVQDFIKTYSIKCPVVLDTDGKVFETYQAGKWPALYFLNSDGEIKIKKFPPIKADGEVDSLLKLY
jgi:peroxiredoxin/V8-like Glu-specific endopeptidase